SDSFYAQAFLTFLDQPHVGRILWFILFFRTGESFLMRMKYPFLKSIGMSLEAYGWASGTVGMVAALVAPALGGWLIARDGLRRWIWPFVIAQNLLNLAYWGLATSFPEAGTLDSNGLIGVGAVITLEMFGAGLGTAVFMVYIMRVPLPDHKAAHTAILTALMSFGFLLAGVVSGFLAEWLGFGGYFLFTVAATVPGMLVIPFLPYLDGPRRE
ncbi:MAG: MFS transporter, partial [Myxococcota bacterium]